MLVTKRQNDNYATKNYKLHIKESNKTTFYALKRLNSRSKDNYSNIGTKAFISLNSLENKGFQVAFYLKRETIPKKDVICSDNK